MSTDATKTETSKTDTLNSTNTFDVLSEDNTEQTVEQNAEQQAKQQSEQKVDSKSVDSDKNTTSDVKSTKKVKTNKNTSAEHNYKRDQRDQRDQKDKKERKRRVETPVVVDYTLTDKDKASIALCTGYLEEWNKKDDKNVSLGDELNNYWVGKAGP